MKKTALNLFISFGLVSILCADDNFTITAIDEKPNLNINSSNLQILDNNIKQEQNQTEIEILDEECKKSVSSFYGFIHLDENKTTEIAKMYQECIDKKHKSIERKEKKRKEEQERLKSIEEYERQKLEQEQYRLNSFNSNLQTETNSSYFYGNQQ